jgi:hypothetical protein
MGLMKPVRDSGEGCSDRPPRLRLRHLYGIAADSFSDLGGGENFIREERELLNFRKQPDTELLG